MSILQLSLTNPVLPKYPKSVSSISFFSNENSLFLLTNHSNPSLTNKSTTIRMGGGPRTFPGGVSKWQWKRMQAKKSKQLLKARLARERQIYEMRKRAELQAAVSELERPWEVVEKAPTLFSATADDQLRALADRFQKPGGFDLWSDNDGPRLITDDGYELPSSRFFPKGVVHSIKPYGRIRVSGEGNKLGKNKEEIRVMGKELGVVVHSIKPYERIKVCGVDKKLGENKEEIRVPDDGRFDEGRNGRITKNGVIIRGNSVNSRRKKGGFKSEVYDMNLQKDGRYEVET